MEEEELCGEAEWGGAWGENWGTGRHLRGRIGHGVEGGRMGLSWGGVEVVVKVLDAGGRGWVKPRSWVKLGAVRESGGSKWDRLG